MKTLVKEHGLLSGAFAGSDWSVQENASYGNWRILGTTTFVSSTYFDLAGMSMEEKTLFFQGAAVQSLAPPKATNGVPGDSAFILDLMSTSPLTDVQLSNYASFGNFAQPSSTLEFSETVYARIQIFAITQDQGPLTYMVITSDNQTGSMEPTASDRIYSYRLVVPGRVQATGLVIYPARHILSAEAREEPDFQYIMRLKRDYDLQQEPDVD